MWLVLHGSRWSCSLWPGRHGVLAGFDSGHSSRYLSTGLLVLAASVYRYWIVHQRRSAPGMHSEVASQ